MKKLSKKERRYYAALMRSADWGFNVFHAEPDHLFDGVWLDVPPSDYRLLLRKAPKGRWALTLYRDGKFVPAETAALATHFVGYPWQSATVSPESLARLGHWILSRLWEPREACRNAADALTGYYLGNGDSFVRSSTASEALVRVIRCSKTLMPAEAYADLRAAMLKELA